jgi:L-asparaginase
MSKILMIYTGGTIGMVKDPSTGLLRPLDFEHLLKQIPELNQFDFTIDALTFDPVIDSSEIFPAFWQQLAGTIAKHYDSYDGFVVLHGTDTMAYTASALSFMLRGLSKPVILTGSQLPIGTLRTDGKENLISSLEIAAAVNDNGEPVVPEVSVYFEYKLFRGNRTTKYSAETFNAFQSPNYPLLAETGVHILYNHTAIMPYNPDDKLEYLPDLSPHVVFLKVFPGLPDDHLEQVCNLSSLQGIILETYGAGNAPTRKAFLDPLRRFIDRGGIILNVSQCSAGRVDMEQYETGKKLLETGVTGGKDLTKEAALIKMMQVLATKASTEEKKIVLQTPICGEMHS